MVFQRIARGDQPPHPVEIEPAQRFEADLAVAVMGGIERAAEQANRHARFGVRQREVFVRQMCLKDRDAQRGAPAFGAAAVAELVTRVAASLAMIARPVFIVFSP